MKLLKPSLASLLALATTISLGCLGTKQDEAAAPPAMPPPPVAVAKPLVQTLATPLRLTGRFVATEQVDLLPQVGGRIVEVLVSDGATVNAGDVLMRLETAHLEANVAQAKANQQRAQAEIIVAQQRFDRSQSLVKEKVLSQQSVDDAQAALAVAKANSAAADATAIAAQVDLDYATITAPISGRVGRILTTTGNVVQANTTHLLTIISDAEIDLQVDLAEDAWLKHAPLLQAVVNGTAELEFSAIVAEKHYPAKLHMIDNTADPQGGSVRLFARVDNADGVLLPGVFAQAELHLQAAEEQLLIHEATVMSQLNSRYVYTVDDNGVTSIAPVQLGRRHGALRLVTAGLTGDENIALTNLKKIFFPGMPVAALPGDMQTATALVTDQAAPATVQEEAPTQDEANQ